MLGHQIYKKVLDNPTEEKLSLANELMDRAGILQYFPSAEKLNEEGFIFNSYEELYAYLMMNVYEQDPSKVTEVQELLEQLKPTIESFILCLNPKKIEVDLTLIFRSKVDQAIYDCLLKSIGKIVSHEELLAAVQDYQTKLGHDPVQDPDASYFSQSVLRIRRALESRTLPLSLEAIRGTGYRLSRDSEG